MLWKCTVCGMIVEGENPPATCPKCGAPAEKFVALSQEDTDKIYASDKTNDLHMEIIALCHKICHLSEKGIELKLDPNCVTTFEKAKDEAWIIKQRCKAEIAAHIAKGKW